MGCTLLTAFVHLCVLFSGILVHLVAILTGYVDIVLNCIVFLESIVRCSSADTRLGVQGQLCVKSSDMTK